MNISYNQRFYTTEEKIEKALFSLLHIREYNDVSIKEICYEAGINRSSFYAHYQDINDLMIKTERKMSNQISKIFYPISKFDNTKFEKMFQFLMDNKDFYLAYLKTNQQAFMEREDFLDFVNKAQNSANFSREKDLVFHMAFFAGGIKAVSKMWMMTGCKQTPKEMANIIMDEYLDKK